MLSRMQGMTRKEQILFYSCCIATLWALVFFFILQPNSRNSEKLQQKTEYLQEELVWMQKAQVQIDQLRHGSPADIRSTIDNLLKDFDEEVYTMQSPSQNTIVLDFSSVLYTELIYFAENLHKHGVIFTSLTAKNLDKPGKVEAQMTFEGSS